MRGPLFQLQLMLSYDSLDRLCSSLTHDLCFYRVLSSVIHCVYVYCAWGGSLAEWLACWTQAQKGRVQIAVATLSGNSFRQTVHTQAAKLVAALLRVARVTAGLVESNGSLPPGLWLTSPAGWLPRIGISSGTLRSLIEYGQLFYCVCVC